MKIVSDRQRRFFGAVASGRSKKSTGPTPAKDHLMLRENKGRMRNLPERSPNRTPRRVSRRGRR